MKTKLLLLFTVLFAAGQSFAQVHVFEPFNYFPTGRSLFDAPNTNASTSTAWSNYTAGTPDDMYIQPDPGWGLVSLGLPSPTGNAVNWQGGGSDGLLAFNPVSGEGTSIYLSFLLHIRGWDTTLSGHMPGAGYRLVNLGINTSGNVGSGLFIKAGSVAGTFQIGYGNSDNTASSDTAYSPTNYTYVDINTDTDESKAKQFFIVIKYTIAAAGGIGKMWINPTISSTEPGTSDLTHTAVNKIRTSFQNVLFQAHSNANTPDCYVDEIRVTGTWAQAVGGTLSTVKNEIEGLKVYPNPAKDYITIESKNTKLSSVELYNVLGAKVLATTALTNNKLNISGVSKGIYMLKVNAEGASSTKKIVID